MTDGADQGWFHGIRVGDTDAARTAITDGTTDTPEPWPERAVESGVVASVDAYYEWLHEAAVETARAEVRVRERADDQQLIHAVRAMDDCGEKVNELAERVSDWGGSYYGEDGAGMEYVETLAEREPESPVATRIRALASATVALDEEYAALRSFVEREAPSVAPNLAAIAGPVLAARLIALAGGLEALAKKPSGTVQVLGAEDALFAHLQGRGSSPKHGVIYTHDYVRGTRPEDRGSAARAVAGKLSIAARVDYYSGERKPEIDESLSARMTRIRGRATE